MKKTENFFLPYGWPKILRKISTSGWIGPSLLGSRRVCVVNSSMHTGRTGRDPRVDIFTSVLVSLKAKIFFPFFSRFIRFWTTFDFAGKKNSKIFLSSCRSRSVGGFVIYEPIFTFEVSKYSYWTNNGGSLYEDLIVYNEGRVIRADKDAPSKKSHIRWKFFKNHVFSF